MIINSNLAVISGGEPIPAWKDPNWIDIEALYDADTASGYTYRSYALITASNNETVFPAGFAYRTSDGVFYNDTVGHTHIWDKTYDLYDSNNIPYRWISYYKNSKISGNDGTIPNFNNTLLWVIDGTSRRVEGSSTANSTYNYSHNYGLKAVIFKVVDTGFGIYGFYYCSALEYIRNDADVTGRISVTNSYAFQYCYSLKIGNFVKAIQSGLFRYCRGMKYCDFIENSNSSDSSMFAQIVSMERIVLPDDYNGEITDISASKLFSEETLYNDIILKLADRTATTTGTITMGATNLAKLTAEQIAVATARNWTLS